VIRFQPMTPEEIARARKLLEAGRTQELNSGKLTIPTVVVLTPKERKEMDRKFEADLIKAMRTPIRKEANDESSAPGGPDES
jgi:hypothetical protein